MRGRVLVVIGICLTVAGSTLTGAAVRQSLRSVAVPVAVRDLPAFSMLEARDVRLEERPAAGLHPQAATGLGEVIGRFTMAPLYAGEAILTRRLSDAKGDARVALMLGEGVRGFVVPVGAGGAWSQVVRDGDRVDVIWSCPESRDLEAFAVAILEDVPVVALITQEATALRVPETTGVVLAVDLTGAARLALALSTGRIHLALRGPEAGTPDGRGPVTVRDLLLGEVDDHWREDDWQWVPAR